MDEFLKPIMPLGREDKEKVIVDRIEAIKAIGKEEQKEKINKLKKKELVLHCIPVLLNEAIQKATINAPLASRKKIKNDPIETLLITFKELLQELTIKDQSKNVHFCDSLTSTWNSLIEQTELLSLGRIQSGYSIQMVERFIQSINTFPRSEEHSFGYYLSEFAGNEWLPFPFLELIKKLHIGYLQNEKSSELALWINLINNS